MHLDALSPPQRLWLTALLILWAALLFGGFIFGPTRDNRRIPRWARMTSSFLLALAAWSWWAFARETPAQRYALCIALGMTFGFLGDLALAHLLGLKGSKAIMGGIGAFAVGHLCYIAGVLHAESALRLTDARAIWGALGLLWLIAVVGWRAVVMRGAEKPAALHWAALPYALLLATTAGLALSLALQDPAFIALAAGAFLFLISDLILAGALFNDLAIPLIHDIVWLTYGPGQMLIVFSIGAMFH